MEQTAGPFDVHLVKLRGTACKRYLRGQVDDALGAGDSSPERRMVRDGSAEVGSAVDS
jgi:hypothetical protein